MKPLHKKIDKNIMTPTSDKFKLNYLHQVHDLGVDKIGNKVHQKVIFGDFDSIWVLIANILSDSIEGECYDRLQEIN